MSFDWRTFLFEILNFVVLAYLLHRLLYRPLREAIEKRRDANIRAQEDAEKARKEADAMQLRLRDQLASAEQERQGLVHQAREQAEAERRTLLASAEQTAQQRREEVRQAIEHEREDALKALRQEVIGQAIELTGRLLGEAAERTLHQQLAMRLVQTLEQLPPKQREQLGASWQSGDGPPVLESAQELDAGTLDQLNHAVTAVVGRPVALAVQNRPDLIGGVRLRLGGQVWDGSLAGQVASATFSSGKNRHP
jgi:F-type H+-transporting ATPase subunit b